MGPKRSHWIPSSWGTTKNPWGSDLIERNAASPRLDADRRRRAVRRVPTGMTAGKGAPSLLAAPHTLQELGPTAHWRVEGSPVDGQGCGMQVGSTPILKEASRVDID